MPRFFVLGLLFLVGCAGPKQASEPLPPGLDEVNRALDDVQATIVWRSGKMSEGLAYVRATPDSVRYRRYTEPGAPDRWERGPGSRVEESTRSRPIEQVRRITKEEPGGLLTGFVLGASPGVLLVGLGALTSRNCSGSPCTVSALTALGGTGLAVGGGLLGGIIGGITGGERHVVYVGPVERYLHKE